MTIQQYEETTASQPDVFHPLHRQDTDSWVGVIADVVRLAQEVANTEFVPRGLRGSVPATAAAMLYGREVGLPPMTALTAIHVIEGRPGMSAEQMRSLVFAAGHELVFAEATGATCRMRARRRGSSEWTELVWTIDQARSAGLTGRDNWKKYPRDMLIARCTTALCRMVFPDVIHGFRSTEELEDLGTSASQLEAAPKARTTRVRRQPVPAPEEPKAPELPPLPPAQPTDAGAAEGVRSDAAPAATPDDLGRTTPSGVAPEQPGSPAATRSSTEGEPGPRAATRPQIRMLHSQMGRLGLGDDREERMLLIEALAGRPLASSNDLTYDEAQQVVTAVSSVRTADALRALVAAVEAGEAPAPTAEADSPTAGDVASDAADEAPAPEVDDGPDELALLDLPEPGHSGRDQG